MLQIFALPPTFCSTVKTGKPLEWNGNGDQSKRTLINLWLKCKLYFVLHYKMLSAHCFAKCQCSAVLSSVQSSAVSQSCFGRDSPSTIHSGRLSFTLDDKRFCLSMLLPYFSLGPFLTRSMSTLDLGIELSISEEQDFGQMFDFSHQFKAFLTNT